MKGDPTVYQLKIDTSYSLLKKKKFLLTKQKIIYNNDDKFELSHTKITL